MKKYSIWLMMMVATLFACDSYLDELDTLSLTDFAPGLAEVYPGNNAKVVKGDFELRAVFVDGTVSPLASATITLKHQDETEIYTATKTLSGTSDSIVVAGSDFDAASLDVGFYILEVVGTDVNGQTLTQTINFEISNLPFPANFEEMYIAGPFNNWGADAFVLTGPNTWTISEIELDGTEWKLKNCADWCDRDFADTDGDGVLEETTGGGPNSAPAPAGLYNIIFNDQAMTIRFEPAVTFAQNVSELYLLGNFNDFTGTPDFKFNLLADNTWEIAEVQLPGNALFKFSEGANFEGVSYGDNEGDGIADPYGGNISLPEGSQDAFYKVTFNDKTLEYALEFLRFPSIGIIGSATPGGWDADTDLTDLGDGWFELILPLTEGEAKFRANDAWDTNWGGSDFPSGTATLNGPNIPISEAGTYQVRFNPSTGEYSFNGNVYESIGIIGSATPGGWDNDTDMTDKGDGIYEMLVALNAGEAKFRANDGWDINWGAGDFPSGTATAGGDNIPINEAGTYLVSFNVNTGEYTFTKTLIEIIGDATPNGWDAGTDMVEDPNTPGLFSLTITLTDGEAKFRMDDSWDYNWGATDFPTGTGTPGGANIPVTAGEYTVSFNLNTGEYAFQ